MNNQSVNIKELISKKDFLEKKLAASKTNQELLKVKSEALGNNGVVTKALAALRNITDSDERSTYGQAINEIKQFLSSAIKEKEVLLETKNRAKDKINADVTALPPYKAPTGNPHIYTKFYEEIENIFISMGFEVFDGPEVETDFFNFTALNIGKDHPARDMYDTLWVNNKDYLLRTHTSPVQIRAMQKHGAPIAGICTGRTFRHEAVDATHDVVFSQCEGVLVDTDVNLSHLFGVAKVCLQRIFGKKNLDIRVRPGFFPFVVPGVEIDMQCVFCTSGCRICKHSTWLEVCPGGLIHPNVLKAGGIDSSKYSGFAFGFGIDRLLMLRHQIQDIRLFKSGDVRFLSQF